MLAGLWVQGGCRFSGLGFVAARLEVVDASACGSSFDSFWTFPTGPGPIKSLKPERAREVESPLIWPSTDSSWFVDSAVEQTPSTTPSLGFKV